MEETKTLQQLPELQNIAEYLRGMTFRKKFIGGVDKESVLEHFSAVTQQYEAIIANYMRQAETNARRLTEVQTLLQGQGGQYAAPAPQPAPPPQWYGGAMAYPQAQQMQPEPPYAVPNPWAQANEPWIQQGSPQPIAPQPYAPQPSVPQPYDPQAGFPQPFAPQPYAAPPPGYPQGFPPGHMHV